MPADEKWKANMEKVAFMKAFPGLLRHWEALAGKTVEAKEKKVNKKKKIK